MLDPELNEALAEQKLIVDDIARRTGRTYQKLGGIDTKDEAVAKDVLPILVEWTERVNPRVRGAIFLLFATPHASRCTQYLIEQWTKASGASDVSDLTTALCYVLRPGEAEHVWQILKQLPRRPGEFQLLAKLAEFPGIDREVKERVVAALDNGSLTPSDLEDISKIRDPRIVKWFEAHKDSSIPAIRRIAKRVLSRVRDLPAGMQYASKGPDRSRELFSAEVGLAELGDFMRNLAERFSIRIPGRIRTGAFLESVQVNQWLLVPIKGAGSRDVAIWFRLEDIDVVELVLTPLQEIEMLGVGREPALKKPD